jgi:hypothetical protein
MGRGGGGVTAHILKLGTTWGESLALFPGPLTLGQIAPGRHWILRWTPEPALTLWRRGKQFSAAAGNQTLIRLQCIL